MEIIPAIDIINGQCVRLSKGDYETKKTYHEDPLEVALAFEKAGINRLHLVDLDGAKAKHVVNIEVLQKVSKNTKLHIDFGGGVKTDEDIKKVFEAGARQVTGGSIAAKNKEVFVQWLERYGGEKVILGADVLANEVMVSGWQEATNMQLDSFIDYFLDFGLQYVVCTDISKDGMLEGPAIGLYKELLKKFPQIKLVASGGVSNMQDLIELRDAGLFGAIVGKAYYEGRVSLDQLASF